MINTIHASNNRALIRSRVQIVPNLRINFTFNFQLFKEYPTTFFKF
jgi:hypothetical protein